MKKLTFTTAIFMAMAATSVFAHHPSADMNPNYDMVDAQLEAVDSPHLDMDVSDMGATSAAGDSDMATAAQGQAGFTPEQSQDGSMSLSQPQAGDGPSMDAAAAADTIDLLENVGQ
jgi:hypothetical protein